MDPFQHDLDIQAIQQLLPHRYPFLLVDRILDYEDRKRIIGLKNVSINEPFFQGHFQDKPIMPNVLILEALAQTGAVLLLKDSDFSGRYAFFASMDKVTFKKAVEPGDQLRLEMEQLKVKDNLVTMQGNALVEGQVVCTGHFSFSLALEPSKPQIHKTATVHRTAVLGKNVVIGANSIIGEHVVIGDNTILEAQTFIEKWTQIGQHCHLHYGSVIGSAPQDVSYKGEKSFVIIGDRNEIREYVTINRASGKEKATEIGSDNLFLTNVHIAHNCTLGNHIVIANMTNVAGHTSIENHVIIGGMTGIHQFVRIGEGAMVGAYTRLPQDVPPYMLCEGNPATIRSLNSIGLRRRKCSKTTLNEVKDIHTLYYRSNHNTKQALEKINALKPKSKEGQHLATFLNVESKRGTTKKVALKKHTHSE